MEPRLRSHMLATALIRLAEREGGFGAILAKGDPDSGAMTVLLLERGVRQMLLERVAAMDGLYTWRELGTRAAQNDQDFAAFLGRRRRIDPDMWLIELDVPSAERFADELRALD